MRDPLLPLVLLSLCAVVYAKTGRTYYTDERVATAQENVARYDWARNTQKRIVETGDEIRYYIGPLYTSAEAFAAQSDEFLWLLQPTTEIDRMYDIGEHPNAVCPVHGAEVKRYGPFNPWRINPLTHPYQIQCPLGGEWYPSNRYDQGDLTSGDFPDDGRGCLHNGQRWHFLVEYAHMVYGSVVVPTVTSLSQAYLLTGDPKYAHKGCILMARLATQYPNYGWEGTSYPELEDRTARTYLKGGYHPHYTWKDGGMISDLIWECFLLERLAYAYDGLYDGFDDPDVLAFVRSKGLAVESGAELREYIEDYILRAGMVGLQRKMIHGNEGHHQACALALALVADDFGEQQPNSLDMLEYAYHGIGGAAYLLPNGLLRDGGGHESPGYNTIKLDFIRVAERTEELRALHPDLVPAERYPDLFAEPKAKALFTHFVDLMLLDRYLPPIGDTSDLRKPERMQPGWRRYSYIGAENLFAFRKYGDPRLARAATTYSGDLPPGDLWEPYPEDALRAALADPASRIERKSRLLDGYGIAILESGEWPNNRAVALNYSSTIGHRQNDQLALWVFGHGVDLLPDLGYPRTWEYREIFDSANLSHNTVTVDECDYTYPRFLQQGCRLFASEGGVHMATAHHNPYPASDLFERTVVLVDVDDERFYLVDLFAVNGGEQHDQSWHGLYVPPEVPDLTWQVQPTGTLAGPEVPEFGAYTDRWGVEHPRGGVPSFLTEVRRAPLEQAATWRWPSGLPEGDVLALHVLPVDGPLQAIMGRGRTPVWVDDKLDYLLLRREVSEGAPTRYLSVLDNYVGAPTVQSVRLVSTEPLMLAVTRADGEDEIEILLPPGPSRTTAPRPLGVRVTSRTGEQVTREVRIGAALGADGYAQGRVVGLDYARQEIEVEGLREADVAVGRAVRIYNGRRSAMFRIDGVSRTGDRLRLTLDQTALLARLPIVSAEGSRLTLPFRTPFTTNHVDAAGALTDGADDYYYGAWLGEGEAARQILGIANTEPPVLHLAEGSGDPYVGQVMALWQYGVTDLVEVARIAAQ